MLIRQSLIVSSYLTYDPMLPSALRAFGFMVNEATNYTKRELVGGPKPRENTNRWW